MREKIARIKFIRTDFTYAEGGYFNFTEAGLEKLLTLISEEIEKVENPHPHFQGESLVYGSSSEAFEQCRQKILSLLRSEK